MAIFLSKFIVPLNTCNAWWNDAPGTGGYRKLFCSAKAVNASLLDLVVSDDGFQLSSVPFKH